MKPENILLDSAGNVKLSDFGLSSYVDSGKLLSTLVGSPLYCAPELFRNELYSGPEVDIWALGVILFTMVTGCFPWTGDTLEISVEQIKEGKYAKPIGVSKGIFLEALILSIKNVST